MSIDNVMGVSTFSEVLGVSNPGKVMGVQDIYQIPISVFDGTNDYLTRGADITGLSDGKVGTVSFWFEMNGGNGSLQYFMQNPNGFFWVSRDADNKISVYGYSTGSANVLRMRSSTTYTADGNKHHFVASWDLAAGVGHMYVDGASVKDATQDIFTNTNIDYTQGNWGIGGRSDTGANKINADLGQAYFTNQYVNVPANIASFYNSGPVNMGPTGNLPTGTDALIYLNNPYTSFETNLGTGGNFTENGALADGGYYP